MALTAEVRDTLHSQGGGRRHAERGEMWVLVPGCLSTGAGIESEPRVRSGRVSIGRLGIVDYHYELAACGACRGARSASSSWRRRR